MTMMKWEQDRNEWLKGLKEGDEVAYDTVRYGGERNYVIKTVKKITPTGKIRLDDGTLFDENGEHRSGSGWYRTYYRLVPLDQDVKDSIRRNQLLYELGNVDFKKFPLDKLEEIMKIIS